MIRLGLVGCSNVRLYERLARRVRSAGAVLSIDLDRAGALHEGDLQSCDAVVIESSLPERASLAVQAAASRKHVLVAPPLARTVDEAGRILESCRRAGVCLMVGLRKRFLPAAAVIKSRLDAGTLGRLGLVRIHQWEPRESRDEAPEDPFDRAIEGVDLAGWLFGSSPAILHATGCELGDGRCLQVHLGFAGGGMALLDHAPALSGARGYFSLSAIGSSGAAYADDHHNTHLLFRDGDPAALISRQENESLLALIEEFVRAISEGRAPAITGEDGLDLIETSAAIRRSITCGGPVARKEGSYEPVE